MGRTPNANNPPLLETRGLTKYFGGLAAVYDLNLTVRKGDLMGLIGPNGAGKTTTFNLCSGFLQPATGMVLFRGIDISRQAPHNIVRLGLVRSFQANVLFMDKTVRENVLMGFHTKFKVGFFREMIKSRRYRQELAVIEEKTEEILDFLKLMDFKDQPARNLAHGHQRTLGMAIALASDPELLLLDEPVAGLNDEETAAAMANVRQIRDKGVTILLVEHDMKAVMENCERIVVMNYGTNLAEGTPQQITADPRVIEAYLGAEESGC